MAIHKVCRILHLDDDELAALPIANGLKALREPYQFSLTTKLTSQEFLDSLAAEGADIALVDIILAPHDTRTGLEVIGHLTRRYPELLVVAISNDMGAIREAVELGAADFISKATPAREVAARLYALQSFRSRGVERRPAIPGKTGESIAARIPAIIESAIRSVLVCGETGTGKDVVARAFESALGDSKPFVKVNCAAVSVQLLESELFGHAKGSFTGASSERMGFIEAASGGWLYLDEVHHLSLSAQAALLRALESGEFNRVGEHKTRRVDLRVLSATNVDLANEARQGRFKADLYQRLREAVISLPPLRERRDEIGPLIEHFLATEDGGPYRMSPEAMAILTKLDWAEGNARELRNCIRAMTERRIGSELNVTSIPRWAWERVLPRERTQVVPAEAQPQLALSYSPGASFDDMSLELLRAMVEEARRVNPHLSLRDLAARLGMPKTTLVRQLKRAGVAVSGKEAS